MMNSPIAPLVSTRFAAAALAALALSACKDARGPSASHQAQQSPAGAAAAKLSTEQQAALRPALVAYEAIRELLAKDEIEAAVKRGEALRRAADKAKEGAPPAAGARLEAIAAAAKQLAAASPKQPKRVRVIFGDVSKSIVALIAGYPALRQGRHVFECPMSPGYKKWAQSSPKIDNPYMGRRMPRCGSESSWP